MYHGNRASASARAVLLLSGSLKGFTTLAKQKNAAIVSTHCFLYTQVLVSKSVASEAQTLLDETIKIVNNIKNRLLEPRRVLSRFYELGL
jgi:hypothetical protein